MKSIDNTCVEAISRILGELTTGPKITKIFSKNKWIDHDTEANERIISTKWRRINESMIFELNKSKDTKPFFKMIEEIMNPVLFKDNEEAWVQGLKDINFTLRFYGYELNDAGKVVSAKATHTFSEAVQRSKHLIEKLEGHKIHKNIIKFCEPELLNENFFHAILEAGKSVLDRIRSLTLSSKDGNTLINEAFNLKNPAVIINGNRLSTDDEKSQYNGLKSLLNTICYIYRNPTAHSPKLYNHKSENDAITAFILISLAHEQLDQCSGIKHLP